MPDDHLFMDLSTKFYYCCCEEPEIDIIGYRERPITLVFVNRGEKYKGPRSKMVPIRRCVICGGYPRKPCSECANLEYSMTEPLNNYCQSCLFTKYSLFEKVRTLDEGCALQVRILDREIAIFDVRDMKPTQEQRDAFLEVHPEWDVGEFNSYRASQFKAFCQGWNYIEKVPARIKFQGEPVDDRTPLKKEKRG